VSGVTNNERAGRFEVAVDGHTGILKYVMEPGNRINLVHTEVPPELEGRGLGGTLAKAALEHARASGLRVTATCPFVRGYIDRHPEFADLVSPGI
jgi:predicted GNAT family acetyltransferase